MKRYPKPFDRDPKRGTPSKITGKFGSTAEYRASWDALQKRIEESDRKAMAKGAEDERKRQAAEKAEIEKLAKGL